MARDTAFKVVQKLSRVACGIRHHRYPDFRAAVQVQVTCFRYGDAGIAPTQLGDERPYDASLLLERVHVAQQHVERQRSYIHGHRGVVWSRGGAPVPPPAGPIERLSGLRGCGY
jgi:hypothetical protein